MKNYKEIANSVFERREQYETEKIKKRKIIKRTVTPICCVCLVALLGFGVWQSGLLKKQPIQSAEDSVIIGEKDWYGPGEDEPAVDTNTQKPFDNSTEKDNQDEITVNNNQNTNNHISEDNTGATNDAPQNNEKDDFSEIILSENYIYEIEEGQFSEYFGGKIISAEKIGNKIADVTLKAGWKNADGSWKSQEKLCGEVYSIDDVEEKVAVALKFIDKGEAVTTIHYYVIMNPEADLSVVEDYIIQTGAENTGEMVME